MKGYDNEPKLSLESILAANNIAEELNDDELSKIGSAVVEGYSTDLQSRSGWETKVDEWMKLALQVVEQKNYPWRGAANVKYPLITTAAMQFSARSYPALVPTTNVVKGKVIGFDMDGMKAKRAIRIGKHMSYQLLEEMEDWEEEMDRLLFALPIVGCMFKKTYYSALKQTNVSEIIYPKDLVINYWSKSIEEASRITHVIPLDENDIYERIADGIFIEQELVLDNENSEQFKPVSSDVVGLERPEGGDPLSPFTILEQHVGIDLDGDGYKEPYIVTVDSGSKKVLRIVRRFNNESIKYSDKDKVIRIKPDQYYTKFSFIPAPDGGFYDIGFGVLLGPINQTINTLVNQLLDAGTLSNMQSGFIARGIRIKGGTKTFEPGEWKVANTAGDDLRKGLVPLPVREPSQVLMSLLTMMIGAGEKLSSVTDIMTGQIPGQNTKATVALNATEQGMKVFTAIHKRVYRALAKEFKKLFLLNSRHLPPQTYFTMLDPGEEEAALIGQGDYDIENADVRPAADPNIATQEQRMAKVQALFELIPMGTVNPKEVTRRYLEATDQPAVKALMEMPPPQPNPEVEFEKMKFDEENQRAWEKLDIERITAEGEALKDIADAEAAEEGVQLDIYQKHMDGQASQSLASEKLRQFQQSHQQKMEQQEQQNQQKMRQSEQQNQQKMNMQRQQAQAAGGNNSERQPTGTNQR